MKMLLLAAAGGAIGAAGRYVVNSVSFRMLGMSFPWGTFIVNILGSLLMGVLIEAIALRFSVSNETRTFLATGILGGFTTFSSFSLDVAVLAERKDYGLLAAYLGGSVGLGILALFAGMGIARAILQ
jgi:CrcB protein